MKKVGKSKEFLIEYTYMGKRKLINFRGIFYPFLMFLLGIVIARDFYSGDIEILVTILLLLSGIVFGLILTKHYKILIGLIALFFIGNGFYFLGESCYKVDSYNNKVSVVGRVSDNYDKDEYVYNIILDDVKINGNKEKNISIKISNDFSQEIEIGDIIAVECNVEKINLFTLRNFNSFYYRNNIAYSAKIDMKNIVISQGYLKLDEKIRQSIKKQLYNNMSEENAGMSYAVLFGDKSGIDNDTRNDFRNSGIIHILTVSGLHIGFLIALVYGFLKLCRVNRYVNFALTIIFIIIYAYLCNFSPSVVRAGIMGIVMMTANITGRRYDSLNSLGIAGFCICIFSPLSALDSGFLMSVFCVIGISFLYSFFNSILLKFLPKSASNLISLSFSAQLSILPFLAMFGSIYNFLSVFANLIIVPLFGVIYPFLFVSSIISAIIPVFGFLLYPVQFIFSFIANIAKLFSSTPLQISLQAFHFVMIVLMYIFMFMISEYFMVLPVNKFLISSVMILSMTCCFGLLTLVKGHKNNVVILNSYDESSIILTNKDGESLLIGNTYILNRYSNSYHINQFDYYLSFKEFSSRDVGFLKDYNIKNYYALEGEKQIENFIQVEKNKDSFVGNFKINFVEKENKTMGLVIYFDSLTIFIANQTKLDYNEYYSELLKTINPNLVISNKNNNIGDGYFTVSINKNNFSKYSYQENGNLALDYLGDKFAFRRLD